MKMSKIIFRRSLVYFQPMNELPEKAKDLSGNEEDISISVLAYDIELDVWTIAWYNYDTENWQDHSGDSLKFSLWCKFPYPNQFIERNKNNLIEVKNVGYQK